MTCYMTLFCRTTGPDVLMLVGLSGYGVSLAITAMVLMGR
jgi:hypothetical protein